ncbi:hypothetical protein J2X90_005969 [Variovorax paradoxus]|uniref:tyrosinase family protein n=1 Tax=Variovorax paradoxus TaxID=34073 RepID=UPI00278B17D6|nr:tyrosinase family protein [Variovorax paradoxus]MDQ0028116.1 hypothetical protein [Variovorax paradoxus]
MNATSYDRRSLLTGALAVAGSMSCPSIGAPTPLRPVRRPIESISSSELQKLEGAVKEMMDRSKKDARDPKGWSLNAESHNEFCSIAANGPNQIHFCYWFLPWHRAYLAVTERKLREIANDSSLALPYWNWSTRRTIPNRFSISGSPLATAVRYTPARALADDEVDYLKADPIKRALVVAALGATKFVAKPSLSPVSLANELAVSFGGLPRPNALNRFGNSRLEGVPHGPVHGYVGGSDPNTGQPGDMSDFATAARDPLFFAHHGNLDRLWENWRNRGNNKSLEPDDKAFLNHRFSFPWIDGSVIQVTAEETMSVEVLGYSYDSVETGDPNAELKPEAFGAPALPPILQTDVPLPFTPEADRATPKRYTLLLEGVQTPRRLLSAGVFVAPADGPASGRGVAVGNISVVPNGGKYTELNPVLVFDVTAAVATLKTARLRVLVIPNALGGEERRPVQRLPFRRASIVLE